MRSQIILFILALFVNESMQLGDPVVKCPVISCDTTISDYVCYQHSGTTPVEKISTFFCPYDQVCNIYDGEFAWVTSKYQRSKMPTQTKKDSQIYKKFTEKSCESVENLGQNLENGRDCDASRLCKSAFCEPKSQKCRGLDEGQSCIRHSQCNVELACQRDKAWPYVSLCGNLTKVDQPCDEDKECELDSYCWYKTPFDAKAKAKKCLKMYSQKDGAKFGYAADAELFKTFKYRIHENFNLGRYCQSGMAVIDLVANLMTCVQISSIKTNVDSYATKQKSPFECLLPKESEFPDPAKNTPGTYMDACKYYYLDGSTEKLINSDYCECSLMEEKKSDAEDIVASSLPKLSNGKTPIPRKKILKGRGHCPFPNQLIVDKYVKEAKKISAQSIGVLHTEDRNNKVAQLEIMVLNEKLVTNATWSEHVIQYFQIENWPYIQSNQTYTCVNSILEYSPNNMFKLESKYIKLSGVLSGLIALYNIY